MTGRTRGTKVRDPDSSAREGFSSFERSGTTKWHAVAPQSPSGVIQSDGVSASTLGFEGFCFTTEEGVLVTLSLHWRVACQTVAGLVVAACTVAASVSPAVAGSRPAIAAIRTPGDVTAVRVSWGDGHSSTVSKLCTRTSSTTAVFTVPHVYATTRHQQATSLITRLGCHSLSAKAQLAKGPIRLSVRTAAQRTVADIAGANSPGWVSVANPEPMSNSSESVVSGTPEASGGCSTNYPQLSLSAGGADTSQVDELSINTTTCNAVVEIGTPTASSSSGAPPNGSALSSSQAPYNSTGSAPVRAASRSRRSDATRAYAAAVYESAGYWNSWYTDPAQINVAGEADYVHWRWNGGCVTEAAPGGNYTAQNWFSPSGWGRNSTRSTFGQSCYSAYSQQNTVYENDIFCRAVTGSGPPTYVVFGNSYASGRANGGLVGSDGGSQAAQGGCTAFLTYHSRLTFTENGTFIHN